MEKDTNLNQELHSPDNWQPFIKDQKTDKNKKLE